MRETFGCMHTPNIFFHMIFTWKIGRERERERFGCMHNQKHFHPNDLYLGDWYEENKRDRERHTGRERESLNSMLPVRFDDNYVIIIIIR